MLEKNPLFETIGDTIVEANPPKFHNSFAPTNRVANAVVNFASHFHDTFDILPSKRCAAFAEDLRQMGDEMKYGLTLDESNLIRNKWSQTLKKRYQAKAQIKEGLIKQLDKTSIELARTKVLDVIAPAYARCESPIVDKIRVAFKRLEKEDRVIPFFSESKFDPFIKLRLHLDWRISVIPTSGVLSTDNNKKQTLLDFGSTIAFSRFEFVSGNALLIRTLQRSKFEESKAALAPLALLEELFLIMVGTTKCNELFLPTTNSVLKYWKSYDKRNETNHSHKLNTDPYKTELKIYDYLGKKYCDKGKLPHSEFLDMLGDCVRGWKVELT